MNIKYTYRIINVDQEAKSMEIVYESPEYGVLHIGARLPWEDETLEQIVEMYNPMQYWIDLNRRVASVTEGAEGVVYMSDDNSSDSGDNLYKSDEEEREIQL